MLGAIFRLNVNKYVIYCMAVISDLTALCTLCGLIVVLLLLLPYYYRYFFTVTLSKWSCVICILYQQGMSASLTQNTGQDPPRGTPWVALEMIPFALQNALTERIKVLVLYNGCGKPWMSTDTQSTVGTTCSYEVTMPFWSDQAHFGWHVLNL